MSFNQPNRVTSASTPATDEERRAMARVRRAGVRAPESAVLAFVRATGTQLILRATPSDIRAVANAF